MPVGHLFLRGSEREANENSQVCFIEMKSIRFLIVSLFGHFPVLFLVVVGCSKPTDRGQPSPIEEIHFMQGWPSWSPDGRYIAFTYNLTSNEEVLRFGSPSIWVYDFQTNTFGYLTGPGKFPRWNRDGSIVAFEWHNEIYFYYLATSSVRQVTNLGRLIYSFHWLPDGARLSGTFDGFFVIDTTGRISRTIRPRWGELVGIANGQEANWSPGGDLILTFCGFGGSNWYLMLLDSLGAVLRTIIMRTYDEEMSYLCWSPQRDRFIVNYGDYSDDSNVVQDLRIYRMDGTVETIIIRETGGDGRMVARRKQNCISKLYVHGT